MPQGGSDAYQMLPRSLLAERNPLADLVWSPYRLPRLTTLEIWVGTYRVRPLPTITTAVKETGSNPIHQAELASIDTVVATWAVW